MSDCLFCNIRDNKIPAEKVYEDEHCFIINDLYPKAPIHCLIIPNKHIATINDCQQDDTHLIGHIIQTAKQHAKNLGIAENGYRLVFNCNKDGGQEIYHIHCHLLGGTQL